MTRLLTFLVIMAVLTAGGCWLNYRANAAGWNDGGAGAIKAWPASNAAAPYPARGTGSGYPTNPVSVTNFYVPVSQVWTRAYTLVYTNWYYLTTNCQSGVTNGLQCVPSVGTTNLSGVLTTNYICISTNKPDLSETNSLGYQIVPINLQRPWENCDIHDINGGIVWGTQQWLSGLLLREVYPGAPYIPTNLLCGLAETWQVDVWNALSERYHAMTDGGYTNPLLWSIYRMATPGREALTNAKNAVLGIASYFLCQNLATNGTFADFMKGHFTNWVCAFAPFTGTMEWSTEHDGHPYTFPHWGMWGTNGQWMTGSDAQRELTQRLNLPCGYAIKVVTGAIMRVPGWTQGQYSVTGEPYDGWVTITNADPIAFTNEYANYFDWSPYVLYTKSGGAYGGYGHVATNSWTTTNRWIDPYIYATNYGPWSLSVTNRAVTNSLRVGVNTVGQYPDGYWGAADITPHLQTVSQSVFHVIFAGPYPCVSTNGTLITTNLCNCTNVVYLRTHSTWPVFDSNGLVASNTNTWVDSVLASAVVTTAINGLTATALLTNYDVGQGFSIVDYGWDPLRAVVTNLNWTTKSLTPYSLAYGAYGFSSIMPTQSHLLGQYFELSVQESATSFINRYWHYYCDPPGNTDETGNCLGYGYSNICIYPSIYGYTNCSQTNIILADYYPQAVAASSQSVRVMSSLVYNGIWTNRQRSAVDVYARVYRPAGDTNDLRGTWDGNPANEYYLKPQLGGISDWLTEFGMADTNYWQVVGGCDSNNGTKTIIATNFWAEDPVSVTGDGTVVGWAVSGARAVIKWLFDYR